MEAEIRSFLRSVIFSMPIASRTVLDVMPASLASSGGKSSPKNIRHGAAKDSTQPRLGASLNSLRLSKKTSTRDSGQVSSNVTTETAEPRSPLF